MPSQHAYCTTDSMTWTPGTSVSGPQEASPKRSVAMSSSKRTRASRPTLGIRYGSRLGDELMNWAIFEPNEPMDCEHEEIEPEDPDLVRVLADYALTLG